MRLVSTHTVMSASSPKTHVKSLRELEDKKSIKALVVRIDSPGGAVAPSQEIYEAVKALRKTKKVVCSLGDLAASGGYWIASQAHELVVTPSGMVGSIGVIVPHQDVSAMRERIGVKTEYITAGKFKAEDYGPLSQMKAKGSELAPLGTFEKKVPADLQAKVVRNGCFIDIKSRFSDVDLLTALRELLPLMRFN